MKTKQLGTVCNLFNQSWNVFIILIILIIVA